MHIAKASKAAFEDSQLIPSSERIKALREIKNQLAANKHEILAENLKDLQVHICHLF
jgi:glutamate-5-semialdehyde dehydrogenase